MVNWNENKEGAAPDSGRQTMDNRFNDKMRELTRRQKYLEKRIVGLKDEGESYVHQAAELHGVKTQIEMLQLLNVIKKL